MEEVFTDYQPLPDDLPINYLPAALDYLRTLGDEEHRLNAGRVLYTLDQAEGLQMVKLRPENVTNHAMLRGFAKNPKASTTAFGPVLPENAGGDDTEKFMFPSAPGMPLNPVPSLVVIDTGIAFWNRRFRDGAQPLFQAISYLQMNGTSAPLDNILASKDIRDLCASADDGREDEVLKRLAQDFPDSIFGLHPPRDGLWHGTAVTDLAMAGRRDRWLYGVELPASVIRDFSGDLLRGFLTPAFNAALQLTSKHAAAPTTIVLALGFPGGPHDGSHPAARILAEALNQANSHRDVTLVLPAGNHLQDKCHARLPAGLERITWHIMEGDHSTNTIDICSPDHNGPGVALTAPDGTPAQFTPSRNSGTPAGEYHIKLGKADIGAMTCVQSSSSQSPRVLRISLGPTVYLNGLPPVPAGAWQIAIKSQAGADLWVLRDDNNLFFDQGRPHYPSAFFDPHYRDLDGRNEPYMDDSYAKDLRVLRSGTLSVMATAGGAEVVGAQETRFGKLQQASYSGSPMPGGNIKNWAKVEIAPGSPWISAHGNGGSGRFPFDGTSAAAAIYAGALP